MIQFYQESQSVTLTPEQINSIKFETGIETLTKLVEKTQDIKDIIEKLSLAELKALENYKKYITPLADIYGKISKGKADIETTVLDRIKTVNDIYAKSANQLFSGTNNKDNTLYKTLEFTFTLDKLIASNETLHNESVKEFINSLTREHFNKVNFTGLTLIENLQKIYEFIIPNNIRTIYETVLGAAMVVLRIKPLRAHNTAPTYEAITTHFGKENKQNKAVNEFNVIDYIQMKKPLVMESQFGGALQTKSFQDGGYKYNDIVGSVQGDKLEIKFGEICKQQSIIPDETDRNFTYGPFASIYTPEYNNFDIYRFLFGANKMGDSEEIKYADFKPELKNTDVGLYPYSTDVYSNNTHLGQPTNQSQDLIRQKLDKGGNIVLFGFGFSGSGKTYSLIEGNKYNATAKADKTKYDPSILEQFIKDNNQFIQNVEFLDIYPYEKKTYNFNSPNEDKMYDTIKPKEGDNLFEVIQKRLNELEEHRRKHLRICATPNNDSSSRSFLQITINLKKEDKNNKLVFFDMPGSENTVRLRTELLGHEVLKKFNKNNITINEKLIKDTMEKEREYKGIKFENTAVLNFDDFNKCFTVYQRQFIKTEKQGNVTEKFIDYLKINQEAVNFDKNKLDKAITNVFKYCIVQYSNIRITKIKWLNDLNTPEKKGNLISSVSQELNLFLNGYTQSTIIDFYNYIKNTKNKIDIILKILNPHLIKKICISFINNVILRKNEKDEYMYFTLDEITDNKSHFFENRNELDLDKSQFKTIFGYEIDVNPQDLKNVTTDIYDITIFNNDTLTIADIKAKGKKIKYNKVKGKPHPLIKYIIFIIQDLVDSYSDNNDTKTLPGGSFEDAFYGTLIIFIFKYIKFIVKQGEGIVTTLEHLKFFFLSNTFNIEDYNNNQDEANKKFIFDDKSSKNPLDKERSYTVPTEAFRYTDPKTSSTQIIELKEKINIGQMKDYKLLSVLQDLAGETNLEGNLGYKNVRDKDNNEYRYLDLLSKPKITGGVKSLFIMFTNLKIFRDNEKYDNPDLTVDSKTNFDLVCGAAKDTLDFAQSISSTTQGKTETKAHGGSLLSKIKKSPKKFNMKELTKKHKKQNRIQTVKKQLKTNNKKTLYSRHSKKYQK